MICIFHFLQSYFPSLSNSSQKDDIQLLLQERNDLKGNHHFIIQSILLFALCKPNQFGLNVHDDNVFHINSDALQRTNATMRQQYSMVNNWHNSVRELKETHSQELNKFRNINDEVSFLFCSV